MWAAEGGGLFRVVEPEEEGLFEEGVADEDGVPLRREEKNDEGGDGPLERLFVGEIVDHREEEDGHGDEEEHGRDIVPVFVCQFERYDGALDKVI